MLVCLGSTEVNQSRYGSVSWVKKWAFHEANFVKSLGKKNKSVLSAISQIWFTQLMLNERWCSKHQLLRSLFWNGRFSSLPRISSDCPTGAETAHLEKCFIGSASSWGRMTVEPMQWDRRSGLAVRWCCTIAASDWCDRWRSWCRCVQPLGTGDISTVQKQQHWGLFSLHWEIWRMSDTKQSQCHERLKGKPWDSCLGSLQ